jgi:hypothetical protein
MTRFSGIQAGDYIKKGDWFLIPGGPY